MNAYVDEGIAKLHRRMRMAEPVIWGVIISCTIVMLFDLLHFSGVLTPETPDDFGPYTITQLIYFVLFLFSIVLVARWITQAQRNLCDADLATQFTPGWALGWYFVPFANIVMPYKVMKEQYLLSHYGRKDVEDVPGTMIVWWLSYLGMGALGNVAAGMIEGGDFTAGAPGYLVSAIASGLTVVSAIILRGLIKNISRAQAGGLNLSEIFA